MKNRDFSIIFRIMHWSIAICFTVMLITIFLRLTWMNKNHVAEIIQEYLATTDQSLSKDQLITLAKKIRKPMWDWHIYFGYALVGLYTIRLILPLFGQMKFINPFAVGLSSKQRFQYWVYLIFYGCVAISLITGLIIVLGPKNLKDAMEQIHVLSIYYLLTFIVLHLGGVLLAEFTEQKGLISTVISGPKKGV
ncbi:cytochrome b561 [Flavobacterium segetis]|uniref:Cytochrome b561 n=1 Tax=Flavobacterium segetis TaxID=271157 RepID=A0A1M5HNH7_9FLAO|nr:cytochrome b/b6 domain-containing protein [Flavobacterium segetis]SHG17471.1 cytochrome b561 [Flavobacterium segetis]